MIHELLCIGDCRIHKPHIEHQQKTDEEQELPAPLFFQFFNGVMPVPYMIHEQSQKWQQGKLNRQVN
jgi:hypothetical protein